MTRGKLPMIDTGLQLFCQPYTNPKESMVDFREGCGETMVELMEKGVRLQFNSTGYFEPCWIRDAKLVRITRKELNQPVFEGRLKLYMAAADPEDQQLNWWGSRYSGVWRLKDFLRRFCRLRKKGGRLTDDDSLVRFEGLRVWGDGLMVEWGP